MNPDFEYSLSRQRREEIAHEVAASRLMNRTRTSEKLDPRWSFDAVLRRIADKEVRPDRA